MEQPKPTDSQLREARGRVAARGWQRSKAKGHSAYPVAIREDDGGFKACEHCGTKQNPARWPLFFRSGPHAGKLLWTCSTCKLAQADRRAIAEVLVAPPQI